MSELGRGLNSSGRDLELKLGNDILQAWVSINLYQSLPVPEDSGFRDEFGIGWHRMGGYNMVVHSPLGTQGPEGYHHYVFPDPDNSGRYDEIKRLLATYGYEVFIGADVSGTIFEPCSHIRGMEILLSDLSMRPEDVEVLFDKATDFSLQVARNCLDLGVDWIWLGDDIGMQTGMLMSPSMWRRFLKPRMARIINELRRMKPSVIIAYHACGSIVPVIGDLVEIGIDVLNPIQPKAEGMRDILVKQQYGDRLTLHCGIDIQEVLPFAPMRVLESELKRIIREVAPGGGFIFAAAHAIQPDTSVERVHFMLDVLKRFGKYPLSL
jgi:uroporphyrinogen decarboxylase